MSSFDINNDKNNELVNIINKTQCFIVSTFSIKIKLLFMYDSFCTIFISSSPASAPACSSCYNDNKKTLEARAASLRQPRNNGFLLKLIETFVSKRGGKDY